MQYHKSLKILQKCLHQRIVPFSKHFSSVQKYKSNVCIIGSGPASFYTTELLLKDSEIKVDIYEKLPVPFGLIRYGVAPDHPEIKKAINKFITIADNQRCNFYGNINVGKDVSLKELLENYNAVVLAHGSGEDRFMNIPGENSANVFSARQIVGWYNGIPENSQEPVDLDTEVAAVIGHGNVAIDVARILLRKIDELDTTDITEHSLELLRKSRIKKVVLIGRRGPLQVAFSVKELRELTKLNDCPMIMSPQGFEGVKELLPSIQRPRHRLTELLVSTMTESQKGPPTSTRISEIKFYRSPKEIICDSSKKVTKLVLGINKPEGPPDSGKVIETGQQEVLECGLVVRSIGYQNVVLDPYIPFNKSENCIENTQGRVNVPESLYCSGWLKTGPIGVIPTTMRASYETGATVLNDLRDGDIPNIPTGGSNEILPLLKSRGIAVTTFDDWRKIDAVEQERGNAVGKPREKIIDVQEMLKIVGLH